MGLALALFALGGFVLACAIVRALWSSGLRAPGEEGETARLLEAATATAVVTIAMWVATDWALALPRQLLPTPLVFAGAAELVTGVVWLRRLGLPRDEYRLPGVAVGLGAALALMPVVLWVAFALWRGTVLPVYSHDALAYHFPKAAILTQSHGFRVVDVPEPRIATWPCNYELLLSDFLVLTGDDAGTAGIGTLSYVLLAVAAAWIAASWWGSGVHVAIASAAVTTAPLVVLHSGLHKNSLLVGFLAVAAFAWSGRFWARGCRASAALAVLALVLAAGTNVSAAFCVAGALPALVLGAWRHRKAIGARTMGLFVACAGAASLLLGSAVYVANLIAFHRLVATVADQHGGYGDWSVLWQFTAMLVLAPFWAYPVAVWHPLEWWIHSTNVSVWNPFRGAYWWWQENDVWMSHLGAIFSICALLLVPCVLRYRRRGFARDERVAASLAALVAYLLTLPVKGRPLGSFHADVRYVVFVLPFVFGWTLCPWLVELVEGAPRLRGGLTVLAGTALAAYGAMSLYEFGVEDSYAPFEWVIYEFHHPEDRRPLIRRDRAASVFDEMAGADEACAVDVAFDSWVYPAYGHGVSRKVEFLKPSAGDVDIPDDAGWVLVDRSWNIFFGHPKFVDMGQAKYLGRGKPSDDDLKVYRQLLQDPRFEVVYDERRYNQAVFRRRRPRTGGEPIPGDSPAPAR